MSEQKWTHVMMHHSAGADDLGEVDLEEIRRHHLGQKWLDIGYHFVVERIPWSARYVALVGRPLFMDGAHAGVTKWNQHAIGVCLVGNFEENPPPEQQLEEAARLVAGLCRMGGIPPDADHILRHRDVRKTLCPGGKFPIERFVEMVRRLGA